MGLDIKSYLFYIFFDMAAGMVMCDLIEMGATWQFAWCIVAWCALAVGCVLLYDPSVHEVPIQSVKFDLFDLQQLFRHRFTLITLIVRL